ncbi:MAG: GNAT family N-acetyltransferase, partial [Pseudomonadota bacterium]
MSESVSIRTPESEQEFERYFALRWRLLREPWDQPRGSERDELEDRAFHVMACGNDGQPIGVGRVHLNTLREAQIRYMAVESKHQWHGVGTKILCALEQYAAAHGATHIVLHAREAVMGFYESNGYQTVAPSHTLFDAIPHCLMRKYLTIEN